MTEKQCLICGKPFIASGSAKYCSPDCTKAGELKARKEWEERTGYREKKAQWTREYRDKQAQAQREIGMKEAKKQTAAQKRRDTIRRKKALKQLTSAASNGDIDAQMDLAFDNGDMHTYYTLLKQSILDNDKALNIKDPCGKNLIGGVDVYDPFFVENVLDQLEEDDDPEA